MDPMTRYHLVMTHQRELRLEAQERRQAKEAPPARRMPAALGRLLITVGKVLAGVPALLTARARHLGKVR